MVSKGTDVSGRLLEQKAVKQRSNGTDFRSWSHKFLQSLSNQQQLKPIEVLNLGVSWWGSDCREGVHNGWEGRTLSKPEEKFVHVAKLSQQQCRHLGWAAGRRWLWWCFSSCFLSSPSASGPCGTASQPVSIPNRKVLCIFWTHDFCFLT